MEMSGIHVKDMDTPKRNYPHAIFIGSLITVLIFVLGTYSSGLIIPQKDINLTQSLLTGFDNYFKYVSMSWLSPVIAVLILGCVAFVALPFMIYAMRKPECKDTSPDNQFQPFHWETQEIPSSTATVKTRLRTM